jgi:hypothetical protein
MPTPLEPHVAIARVWTNLWNHIAINVIYLVCIQNVPRHCSALNARDTYFCKEDRIWCIAFYFEIIGYKALLDFLDLSPCFPRYIAFPNFTTI